MRTLAWSLAFVLCTALPLPAASCGGAIPCQCGDTVTGTYLMTADLGPCSSHGLLIADNAALDANGHRITGTGGGTDVYGIHLNGTNNATVKNGVVSGFRRGIRLRDATDNLVLNNEAVQNGDFSTHVGYGIDMADGAQHNRLEGNTIHNNADEGIHCGSGSGENTFVANSVYNNFLENIYLLASDRNTFIGNTTWGGQNSIYLKDSAFNTVDSNTFRDKTLLVRGDAHDNTFSGNTFVNTGIHFQVYTSVTPFRYPRDNIVLGGTITGAATCVRFSSSWGNVVSDTVLSNCGTDMLSNGSEAQARNSLIGVVFNPAKVQLDGNSILDVGWHLTVRVRNSSSQPVSGAQVRAFDVSGLLLFDALTDTQGDLDSQDVPEYTRVGSAKTFYTPLTLDTTKTGYNPDQRQLPLSANTTVTIILGGSTPTATAPTADAGPNRTVTIGAAVTLDGSGSSDLDGDPLTYTWDFGDGGPSSSGVIVTHSYSTPGMYVVTLTVSDGISTVSDTATATVRVGSGVADFVDTFDRTDSSLLENGWVETQGDLVLTAGRLENASIKGYHLAVLPALNGPTQNAAADFVSTANNTTPRLGLVLRYQDALNYYVLYRRQSGGGSFLRIAKIVNGKETLLATAPVAVPAKDVFFRLSAQVEGTMLSLLLDDTVELVTTDAAFADGTLGILLGSKSTKPYRADNFSATVE